jgi:hypothetical protein
MRFAAMILLFNTEKFILRTIENCAPHVEKIFVGYSKLPWNAYNKSARENFANTANKEILLQSKYFDKIELVEGEWATDEEQRNAILKKARQQGFDYMIFQDADEFYLGKDYIQNLTDIESNPDHMIYQTPWINFWKTLDHVTVSREHLGRKNTIYTTCSAFAMNLKKEPGTQLTFARTFPTTDIFRLRGVCYHLSYVLSDQEAYAKIGTWGHSHQVKKNWYKRKWLAWTEQTKNINPLGAYEWVGTTNYKGILPEQLRDFDMPHHAHVPLSKYENVQSVVFDWMEINKYKLKKKARRLISILSR